MATQVQSFLRNLTPMLPVEVTDVMTSVPQTQADINQIARVTKQLEDSGVQQDIKIGAVSLLSLQAISTMATVGMFLIAWADYKKRHK